MKLIDVKLDSLIVDEDFNCRGAFSLKSIEELAMDIKEKGLIQPITVMKLEDSWKVIAGFRRVKAFQYLKRENIPAVVSSVNSIKDALIINLSENVNRENLSFMQEAKAVGRLLENGVSEENCLTELAKSTTWLRVRKMALDLPEEVHVMVDAKIVKQSDIKDLHAAFTIGGDNLCLTLAKRIKENKFKNIKPPKLDEVVKDIKPKLEPRTRSEMFAMQDRIREVVGNGDETRVIAWCAGEITTGQLEKALSYNLPKESIV